MKRYNLAEGVINERDINELIKWLSSNPRLTKGELTLKFEEEWSKHVGINYSVFCNSGSSANLLIAYTLKLSNKKNNKVIVPSTGWITTISPFIQLGFEPIMCGTDEDTFCLDLNHLEELLKQHEPSVVVMVQVLGVPGKMDEILELKQKYDFTLVEDACAAYGAEYKGKPIGSFGDFSSFSFYFGHQLSTIEGGIVSTNDEEKYNLLQMLRSHGWQKDLQEDFKKKLIEKYNVENLRDAFIFFVPGFNLRSTDLNAFLGLKQLEKSKEIFNARKNNHLLYMNNLKNVTFQKLEKYSSPCSIHFCAVAKSKKHRKKIVENLYKHGIETRLFTAANLGRHPFWYDSYEKFSHPVSDKLYERGFFLPNNESINEEHVLYICNVVNEVK